MDLVLTEAYCNYETSPYCVSIIRNDNPMTRNGCSDAAGKHEWMTLHGGVRMDGWPTTALQIDYNILQRPQDLTNRLGQANYSLNPEIRFNRIFY